MAVFHRFVRPECCVWHHQSSHSSLCTSAAIRCMRHPTVLSVWPHRVILCRWHNVYTITCLLLVPQGSPANLIKFTAYTEDVTSVFEQHSVRRHMYADDMWTYIDVLVADVDHPRGVLQDCIGLVNSWGMSHQLQLNASKTELIWFGSRASLTKLSANELDL